VTNICVDAEKYKDIDDLINKGIITIPGAKERIIKLLGEETTEVKPVEIITEVKQDTAPVIDETPESEPIIADTPEDVVPIDETPASEEVISDTPTDVKPEVVEEVITTEAETEIVETTKENTKKLKKTKKTE
jgi:hypothetical protein